MRSGGPVLSAWWAAVRWLVLLALLVGLVGLYALARRGGGGSDLSAGGSGRAAPWLGVAGDLGRAGLPIEITIPEADWAALKDRDRLEERYRAERHELEISLGGAPPVTASYTVRGRTSIQRAFARGQPERLNYSIDLHRPVGLGPGLELRRFYLQNMIFDPMAFEMRFCYRLLAELGLFPAHSQLVAMRVNGTPLGLYLLVERPKDAIRRAHPGATHIYRRAYEPEHRGYRLVHQSGAGEPRAAVERLTAALRLPAGEREAALEAAIDLDAYLRWLAFNSIVRNADSFDEVFLYAVPSAERAEGRLGVMAWDYDDILAPRPAHPKLALDDPLLFASEGVFDRVIQRDPRLYGRFRDCLADLLGDWLTQTRLGAAVRDALEEVEPLATGLDPEAETAWKAERRGAVADFETALRARRRELLDVLARDPARVSLPGACLAGLGLRTVRHGPAGAAAEGVRVADRGASGAGGSRGDEDSAAAPADPGGADVGRSRAAATSAPGPSATPEGERPPATPQERRAARRAERQAQAAARQSNRPPVIPSNDRRLAPGDLAAGTRLALEVPRSVYLSAGADGRVDRSEGAKGADPAVVPGGTGSPPSTAGGSGPAGALARPAGLRAAPRGVLPVVVRALGAGGRVDRAVSGRVGLEASNGAVLEPAEVLLRRGVGSATVSVVAARDFTVTIAGLGAAAARPVRVVSTGARRLSGTLEGADLRWGPDETVELVADAIVPPGRRLVVAAGTTVRLGARVNLLVQGDLAVEGTAEAPVVFLPLAAHEPWGGVVHWANATYRHAILTGGGGDPRRRYGHSASQAMVYGQTGSEIELDRCALQDAPGKGLGGVGAVIRLVDGLVARTDMGGELIRSQLHLERSHFLDFPRFEAPYRDDDNDALYLAGALVRDGEAALSRIVDSVFVGGIDDAIDLAGGRLEIAGSWIEGFSHEGVAAAGAAEVHLDDTVIRGCEQGLEAGVGRPRVTADHVLLLDNDVGARFGDAYAATPYAGALSLRNSVLTRSRRHPLRNWLHSKQAPSPRGIELRHSLVDEPGWDRGEGNVVGRARLAPDLLLAPDSPGRGIAEDGGDPGLRTPRPPG